MKKYLGGLLLGLNLGIWGTLLLYWNIGEPKVEKAWHDEAVRRGYAVYYIDGETMERKWRWLDLKELEE